MKKRNCYIGKKVAACLLAGCMVISCTPLGVMAEDLSDGSPAADVADFSVGAGGSEEELFGSSVSEDNVPEEQLFTTQPYSAEEISMDGTLLSSSADPTVSIGTNSIYANGTALIIDGSADSTTVYIDTNGNGLVDSGEQSLRAAGITDAPEDGTDLSTYFVYGGSRGDLTADTRIFMKGGKLQAIYGGSRGGTLSGNTSVEMSGGEVAQGIWGGSIDEGKITGKCNVAVSGGSAENVIGGGMGSENNLASVGSTEVTISGNAQIGSVVGGGTNGIVEKNTKVIMTGGTVSGMIAGGGNAFADEIHGSTELIISGGTVYSRDSVYFGVYGGNTIGGSIGGNTSVIITDGATIHPGVLGAGFDTKVTGGSEVTIEGGAFSAEIYGGGGGVDSACASSSVTVKGGTFSEAVFGGASNGGTVKGDANVTVTAGTFHKGIFGGGYLDKVQGNTSVNISGSTTVVEGAVLGAGLGNPNDGLYAECTNASVVIQDGMIRNNVFGGGDWNSKINGNTNVEITGGSFPNSDKAIFGGTYEGIVNGSTKVTVKDTKIAGFIYGGSNKGPIGQNTEIIIKNSTVEKPIAGGGSNEGTVAGTKSVSIGGKMNLPVSGGILIGGSDGVESFTIAQALTEESEITAILSSDYKAGAVFANSAVASNLEQVNITGSGASDKVAYFENGKLKAESVSEAHYAVNITVKKDGANWSDSGKSIRLESSSGELYKNGSDLSAGTYKIYDSDIDTGKTVTVTDASVNQDLNYYTVTFYDGTEPYTADAFKPQIIVSDKYASAPVSYPSKSGYTFSGWKTKDDKSFNFSGTAIATKTDLYASWSPYVPSYGPYISTDKLPDGSTGAAYEQTLTAGGDSPITWSISKGSLPEGLSLSEGGLISGTPEKAGTFTFTVKADNSSGSDTKEFSLIIESKPIVEGISISPESAVVNAGAEKQFTASVTGKYEPGQEVVWTVEGSENKGTTISEKGLLKIAEDEEQDTLTVRAVSVQDKEKSATAVVTVNKAPMLIDVKVSGNRATAILSDKVGSAQGYDFVIGKKADCIKTKEYIKVNKNILNTSTAFTYVDKGTYYAYCHAWTRGADGKKVFSAWSNGFRFNVTATTPGQPEITKVTVNKNGTVTVMYTECSNATGYDIILGSEVKKVEGEKRPVKYGKLVKKVKKGNILKVTFKNVPKDTYYVGMHAYNRTRENNTKVFSMWSETKKIKVL